MFFLVLNVNDVGQAVPDANGQMILRQAQPDLLTESASPPVKDATASTNSISNVWRDDRVADCAALEMPCPGKPGPGVRIPLSPLKKPLAIIRKWFF